MKPVRMGVLGCADIALRRMLPAMAASPHTEVTAVASRDGVTATAVAREYGCRAVRGYAGILEREDVDAVYVPLPAALHADWVEAALRAGKHVLAEKPLTTDAARTAELVELARGQGLALMENLLFLHHHQHARVDRLLAEGAVGRLTSLHAAFCVPGFRANDIRYRPDLGGGALWDVGVYPLRVAVRFLGPDLEVAGAILTRGPDREVDTAGAVLLRAADGVAVQLTFGVEHTYRSAYELRGGNGELALDRAFTPPADHRPVLRLRPQGGAGQDILLEPDDQVANTVTAFVEAVRTRAAPAKEILVLARLLEEVRHAAG
ncbi:gfo/Idh/MocA family oxidoreductase [Amycolatopsis sp. RM579]|uniref:Gfo/Idh/MocA family oxidoreductase n=2 Tax=Amycolatopsis pithecellobii TaxID=664692 RepID=A0A6N7YZZ3_9PSEU|nr:gfo/Idh/MocA family oxidoreductase [Amycolatopsis pithecellobii]